MERRTFLKVSLGAVAALAFPWTAAASAKPVSYGGVLYRAGSAGKILTSANGGMSWSMHSDLGDTYSIPSLAVDRWSNRLRLTVRYAGRTFPLFLAPNKSSWLTA